MTAPCILRLDAAIENEQDADLKALLLAEKACYLARVGDTQAVSDIRSLLRSSYGKGENLAVSIRLMLLEGLDAYFGVLGGQARDRIARAQLLSVAAKHKELISLSSGWLAHIDFNDNRIADSIRNVRLAIDCLQEAQWDSLVRLALVCGDLHMAYADYPTGRRWYAHAHHAALAYGDQAAIGAWTYNSAAIRLFRLRVRKTLGLEVSEDEIRFAEAEIANAVNFQHVAGVRSLNHLLVAAQSHVHILKGDHLAASESLQELVSDSVLPEAYLYRLTLLTDAIVSNLQIGRVDIARDLSSRIDFARLEELDVDDRIICLGSLNQALELDPDFFGLVYSWRNLDPLRAEYKLTCAAYQDLMRDIEDLPDYLSWAKSKHRKQ